jgi:hypothetical protein
MSLFVVKINVAVLDVKVIGVLVPPIQNSMLLLFLYHSFVNSLGYIYTTVTTT